jgi:hypothetical protein
MQYNYLHDYQTSQWADYGSNGIYLDEQTSGYTVAHNAMVNAPTNVVQNHTGTNTITDTPASNPQSVNGMAGIESAYADIKTLTAPVPTF